MPPVSKNIEGGHASDAATGAREMRRRDAQTLCIMVDALGSTEVALNKSGVGLGQSMRSGVAPDAFSDSDSGS